MNDWIIHSSNLPDVLQDSNVIERAFVIALETHGSVTTMMDYGRTNTETRQERRNPKFEKGLRYLSVIDIDRNHFVLFHRMSSVRAPVTVGLDFVQSNKHTEK